ncbi:Phosphatidylinositol synthase [Trachipleistophora hominis]|uniref:Phosphatidylinositol synthase n=1 Tax=Trachipleistophora hominis TaxID=72359 RepID=L7JUP9_TRAHO|nr:Phosphatidylinositol synthase [Trachipleistophora hominis]
MNKDVLFNIPNRVSYARIILLLTSIFLDDDLFVLTFSVSTSLDLIDGTIARYYRQTTRMGACLDMYTDLSTTTVIVCKILERTPSSGLILALFVDLISHTMFFSVAVAQNVSHKKPKLKLLKIYYNTAVLVTLCAGTGIYHILLYLETYKKVNEDVVRVFFVLFILRSLFNVLRFAEGLARLSDIK